MVARHYPAPPVRSRTPVTAGGLLWAIAAARPWLAVGAALFGALWLVPGALLPLVVGQAIDAGVAGADARALWWSFGLVVGIAVLQASFGVLLELLQIGLWMHAASSVQRLTVTHAAQLGSGLRQRAEPGEVLAITASDLDEIGDAFESIGRTAGAVLAFGVVGAALVTYSPLLGAVALVGVPLAAAGIGPLIAPLNRKLAEQREELAAVSTLGADIVSGLRILRGIGGERQFLARFRDASQRVRKAGVDVARRESWLTGAEVLLPGLVTVVITWLGARLALAGTISVGELVAFYGASAFLLVPVSAAGEAIGLWSSAVVSARKVARVLNLRPVLADPAEPEPLPAGPLELHDPRTGFTAVAGKLTVVDAGAGADDLASRLARFSDADPPARVAEVPVDRVALADLRRRVTYAHNQDLWFSGVLGAEVTPDVPGDVAVETALWAADAHDIVDGLPGGLAERLGERGREVSGGQRQRLGLARALATDADVLLLDDPTSAVDAHTEARITERVATLRHGRTTVVFSQSPLWAAVADEVVNRCE